jgi:membrane-associated phospholipid phosphatase
MDIIMQFEILITLFFQNLGEWLTPIAHALSFLGTEIFYILLLPALYWCLDAGLGFRIGVMLVATNSINGFLKILFCSPRPFWVDSRVQAIASETSFGLPSGHSQNSAAILGLLAVKIKKNWLTIVSILGILFIGLSRIYLGVHFTRDVLSGWLIGLLLVGLFIWLEKPVSKWISDKKLAFQIIFALLISILIIALGYLSVFITSGFQIPNDWKDLALASGNVLIDPFNLEGFFTISGVWFGFVVGYAWLLKKNGSIEVAGNFGQRLGRYLIGLAGLIIIYAGLKLVLPENPLWLGFTFRFIRYGLIGLWVSALAPMLFSALKLDK